MNFYIESPAHWILIVEISVAFGMATYRLYNDARMYRGKARKGLYGYLVEGKQ
jgi:hypothetical protein